MAHIKNTEDTPFMAEINMIPMIDVALVLLIIFMVITPQMLLNSIQVKLPKSASEKTPPAKVATVAIKADGSVYLNNVFVRPGELPVKIQEAGGKSLEGALVYSDRDVQIAKVVEVIDEIESGGIHNINLSTEKKEAPAVQ